MRYNILGPLLGVLQLELAVRPTNFSGEVFGGTAQNAVTPGAQRRDSHPNCMPDAQNLGHFALKKEYQSRSTLF